MPTPSVSSAPLPRGSDRRGFNDLFFNAAEIKRLFSLMNPVFVPGEGLVVEFISANPGEGVSTLARDFALMASQYVDGRVLLLDFDWRRGEHYHFFQSMAQDDPTIAPGPPLALGVDFGRLLRSSQRSETEERALPLTFHQLGDTSLIVSQPVRDLHDTPRVVNQPDFWADLRRSVMLTVVDAPPAAHSFDGIVMCGAMDAVILVVAAETSRVPVIVELHEKLMGQGAPVVGAILNKRRFYIPKWVYSFLSRV
ncbi:MAG: hypothetical protein IPN66_20175 [Candidatus Competibacteraceae bacterium]|nr:hypothetical protein [Candidatus Competibacteraceae bacterium]MBK7984754.1 hypothetical protein [Candidatus Competibacteraceae bacterium]MBK8899479.1 hypothetical protein [Candidatus Competibacteraceae bacterium]MBK8964483.1 hypothetical protein [Candidatus Competibacteraceae bacterium]